MTYRLTVPPEPYHLGRTVTSGQVFRWENLPDGRWAGVDGDCAWVVETGEKEWQVWSTHGPERLVRFLGWERDRSAEFDQILAIEPSWLPWVEGRREVGLLRCANPAEVLISFLCTANNHLVRIVPMVRHLASRGEVLATVEGWQARQFPRLEVVADWAEADLRAAGFGYRGASIPAVAREILAKGGEEWLVSLGERGYSATVAELTQFRSLGRKLADCIALYGYGFGEAVPVDTHLWQAATRHYFPEWQGKAITEARYNAVGDLMRQKFGSLAGLAHHLLFHDNLEKKRK